MAVTALYVTITPVKFTDPWGTLREPGYNKYGQWSENPDADDFGENSAKYKMLLVLGEAWYKASAEDRYMFAAIANLVRETDFTTITTAYYLNDSDGAESGPFDFGHAAIFIKNENGQGILFSYYPEDTSNIGNAPSEMRIGVYYASGSNNLLNGGTVTAVSTKGKVVKESYDRNIAYNVSNTNGLKMVKEGINIAILNPIYDLTSHNCDHIAVQILAAGGVYLDKKTLPNNTYESNK